MKSCERPFAISAVILSVLEGSTRALSQSRESSLSSFDEQLSGESPKGWECGLTGSGNSDWTVMTDPTSPSQPDSLQQLQTGDYPWCVNATSMLENGYVQTKFRTISGRIDQAAGVIWRFKDADNYYIARANALENNISIYHVTDGMRHKLVGWETIR
jgi:hypothetical protein